MHIYSAGYTLTLWGIGVFSYDFVATVCVLNNFSF